MVLVIFRDYWRCLFKCIYMLITSSYMSLFRIMNHWWEHCQSWSTLTILTLSYLLEKHWLAMMQLISFQSSTRLGSTYSIVALSNYNWVFVSLFPVCLLLNPFILLQKLADLSTSPTPRLIDGILLTKFDTIDDKVCKYWIASKFMAKHWIFLMNIYWSARTETVHFKKKTTTIATI